MDFNIEVRKQQLANLDQFISSSKDRVDSILDYLGWNTKKISESHKEMVNCSCNIHHRVPADKVTEHLEKCTISKEGYDENEKLLSEPNYIPGGSILIDNTTKIQVLNHALSLNPHMKTGWRVGEPNPKSSDRLLSVYSTDERLALYNFTKASTKGPPQVPEFNITESKQEKKEHLTEAELKLRERDAKRRRIKYKTKSVHTSRKTTTEITREIINGQMEAYEDWLRHELSIETSSSTNTSIKREPSPQSSSKQSYEEENRPNGYHRSLSKESNQSKYYRYEKHHRHSSHSSREREKSPHRKRKREHYDEFYSPRKHEYDDKEKSRRRSKERFKYIEEYRHTEKEKHRTYKKEYYDDRYRSQYDDKRYDKDRSKERYKYEPDKYEYDRYKHYKYKSEFDDRYYEDKYFKKNSSSVCSNSVSVVKNEN